MQLVPRPLLLTDVVDSTRLAERLGDVAMAALWTRHDRVARDLLAPHHGREIDRTDGFLLLFESAADAVEYAIAYHRAIAPLGLQARAGLHVGPVILRENPAADVARGAKPLEVEGLAKPAAARVMSLALGGQTLLTRDALDALGPTRLQVVSHGHWRMKGLAEPVELFEIGEDDAPFAPPPDGAKVHRVVRRGDLWLPVREVRHNLPAERDPFVGRAVDLQDLARRLDDGARLVSVLGIGGTGKTRLVTRFAWAWLGDFPGGAWFCDLSEARSVDGIVHAVATALDVPLRQRDAVDQLGHAIAARGRCLVVLDNFEQVARHADATLGAWLDRAPDAAFVVTTREVLGLPGENALALAPLSHDDGVALFCRRAEAAKRGFELATDDRPHVDALVRLLDGLPLAIELAAARVRVMPPRVLLDRMSQRFQVLASGGGRHTRQATLRGALDWSWELLSSDERAALAQLSVFEGGFTLDAAEAVLTLDDLWPVDAVQGLVDKSLVRQVSDERFDLLVSVQEYAAEKLDALGARAEVEARHGGHFATWADRDARLPPVAELDNLVVACRRAVRRGDFDIAVATCLGASPVIELRGPSAVGYELASTVLGHPDVEAADASAVGRLELFAGEMAEMIGEPDTGVHLRARALARARAHGDDALASLALTRMADALMAALRLDEARRLLDEALGLAERSGESLAVRRVRGTLGAWFLWSGDPDSARRITAETLEDFRRAGDRRGAGNALVNLGLAYRRLGRPELALAHLTEGLAAHREVGNRVSEANTLGNLGSICFTLGRLAEAEDHFRRAIQIQRDIGAQRSTAMWVSNLGLVLTEQRSPEAGVVLEQALTLARSVGDLVNEARTSCRLGALRAQEGRPETAREHLVHALEIARTIGDAAAEGEACARLGDLERADDPRSALPWLHQALASLRRARMAKLELDVLRMLARTHLDVGQPAPALAFCREALALATDRRADRAHALRLLARAHHQLGDRAAALDALGEAERAAAEDDEGIAAALADARREIGA